MPVAGMLHPSAYEYNNKDETLRLTPDDQITADDILDMLASMNGERGYAEMLDAWSAWDALVKSADAVTRSQMLEACRQFATVRASALRNGAA